MFNNIKYQLMHLHTPAKVYVILAMIGLIMNFMYMSWHHLVFSLAFVTLYTLFIEYAGKKGYRSGLWVLVFLPFAAMYFIKSMAMNRMLASVANMMSSSGSSSSGSSGSSGSSSKKQ
jgi:hypothetical protein